MKNLLFIISLIIISCNTNNNSNISSDNSNNILDPQKPLKINLTLNCEDKFIKKIGAYEFTELGLACYNGDLKKVVELINNGACISNCISDDTQIYDLLYDAFAFDKIDIIRYLINNKIYIKVDYVYDENATTALTLACQMKDINQAYEIANKLIQAGANVNGPGDCGGEYINYPIILAVENNNLKLVQLLLSHDAKTNVSTRDGISLIEWAKENGNPEMFELLNKK